jgi:hypothetical protein
MQMQECHSISQNSDGTVTAEFDINELRQMANTTASAFTVRDNEGNVIPIRVAPLKAFFETQGRNQE